MAHIRQSRPDYGLLEVTILEVTPTPETRFEINPEAQTSLETET